MRVRTLALPALALLLVTVTAQADDDDNPFGDDAPGLSKLSPLADLPPLPDLPELPPLDAPASVPASTPVSAPAPAPAPAPASASAPAALLVHVPAAREAVLGMSNEYRRNLDAYALDTEPVPREAYDACVAAGKCSRPSCADKDAKGRAVCVDLAQATAYCAFVGARLPTEDEWEHAARDATALGVRGTGDGVSEWTSSPYCYFCGRTEEVVRGVVPRDPSVRGWRAPTFADARLGFRCAR